MQIKKNFWKIIFVIYLLILTKIILFKYPSQILLESLQNNHLNKIQERLNSGNLVPFATIENYWDLFSVLKVAKINILANIFAFLPLGFLTPLTFKNFAKIRQTFILSFFISLFYEFIQLIFGIGTFDVDDLILNLSGSFLGFLLFWIFNFCLRFKAKR